LLPSVRLIKHGLISREVTKKGSYKIPLNPVRDLTVYSRLQADIILWDYKKRELITRLSLHKGKIEALAFSPNDLYLVSLGGPDDGR
jgi:WD40 repeat protein